METSNITEARSEPKFPYCYLRGTLISIIADEVKKYPRAVAQVLDLVPEEVQPNADKDGYAVPSVTAGNIWVVAKDGAAEIAQQTLRGQGITEDMFGKDIRHPVRVRFYVDPEWGPRFEFTSSGMVNDPKAASAFFG